MFMPEPHINVGAQTFTPAGQDWYKDATNEMVYVTELIEMLEAQNQETTRCFGGDHE